MRTLKSDPICPCTSAMLFGSLKSVEDDFRTGRGESAGDAEPESRWWIPSPGTRDRRVLLSLGGFQT